MDPLEHSDQPADSEPATLGAWLAYNGPMLGIVAAIAVAIVYNMGFAGLRVAFFVMIGLGFVIFIHELGHFLTAKWCNVYVETFSIGFGPALPGCRFQRGETTYMIALFPLGGYVKMLGEGGENDDEDVNPRSFKNKPVWQRMVIISAGVIMNVILGAICIIFVYMAHGKRQIVGAIGAVETGSPAWVKGMQFGDVIYRIGDIENPSFNDLKITVPLSGSGEMPLAFGPPDGQHITETTIAPRRNKDDRSPAVIGIAPGSSLDLYSSDRAEERKGPFYHNSAAARAEPPFQFGDEVIAVSDPDQPSQVKELPPNQHNSQSKGRDYFEYRRRLQLLAGQPITVRVRRKDGEDGLQTLNIRVPPQYHSTLGLCMTMGRVVAVRQRKPDQSSPIQFQNQDVNGQTVEGDTIHAVEVKEANGFGTRWVVDRTHWLAQAVAQILTGVEERDLDPVRLPHDLKQWAARTPPGPKQVQLTVKRKVQSDPYHKKTFSLAWEEGFRFDNEISLNPSAPQALPELGLAYYIETTVKEVQPNSPATRAIGKDGLATTLKEGDVVKSFWRFETKQTGELGDIAKKAIDLKPHQWSYAEYLMQHEGTEHKQYKLLVERGKDTFEATVNAEEDKSWPAIDRGLNFKPDLRIKKARDIGEAIVMGTDETVSTIKMIYRTLQVLVTGWLPIDNIGGPVMIVSTGYRILEYDFYEFILFLGMISVNLAVVNFLPIPVLDGGHFVFLVYEGLRGKPASKKVLIYTTYIGLCLIVSLMLFVIFMDVRRQWFS